MTLLREAILRVFERAELERVLDDERPLVRTVMAEGVPTPDRADGWRENFIAFAEGNEGHECVPLFSEAFLYPVAGCKDDARFINCVGKEHEVMVIALRKIRQLLDADAG